ncbi:hypothetical protein L1887_25796 [Cichorium endivia]|nr:hypothetical protein L1887_25796 [Cichorium endivia]
MVRVENSTIVATKERSTRFSYAADGNFAKHFVHAVTPSPDLVPNPLYHCISPFYHSQNFQTDCAYHYCGTAVHLAATGVAEAADLAQKAKVKWAIEGDENSKYFHGIINKSCHQLAIRGVFSNGDWLDRPEQVKKEFLTHFADRFSSPDVCRLQCDTEFPRCLSADQLEFMEGEVTSEETPRIDSSLPYCHLFLEHFSSILESTVIFISDNTQPVFIKTLAGDWIASAYVSGNGGIDTGVMETGDGGGWHNTQKMVAIVILSLLAFLRQDTISQVLPWLDLDFNLPFSDKRILQQLGVGIQVAIEPVSTYTDSIYYYGLSSSSPEVHAVACGSF